MRPKLTPLIGLVKACQIYVGLLFTLVLAYQPEISFGQVTTRSHRIDRELFLRYDNDLYFGTDQYYTSGADLIYARVLKPESRLYQRLRNRRTDTLKVIARIQYGHKIFTPSKIKKKYPEEFDRPYAGWHYLKFHAQNFPSVNTSNRYVLEIGLVGERSGIGNFQKWWHDKFDFPTPQGWDYQIDNEVIFNFAYNRIALWSPVRRIGVYSDSGVKIGNGANFLSQEVTLRYGKANRLFNSAAARSRLSHHIPVVGNTDPEEEEGYLFYGIEGRYVASNIFIEGSLIGGESPQTEELESYVIVRKWGFAYSNYYTTFSFVVYTLSKENLGAKKHQYISLNLALRF